MDIKTTRFEANEIAKDIDFDYINDREYANFCTIFEELFGRCSNDIIMGGLSCQERSTPSMNVDLSIGLGYCKNTGKIAHTGSLFGPIAITSGGSQNRIDLVEIRLKETDYDEQQRAFKDPVTGYISYQDIDTKTRFEIEAQVIEGTEGTGNAKNHTTGWIKIAEISVEAGETTSILDADIENCTGGYDTETTTNWTAETAVTFRLGSVEDFKAKFRVKHKENGDHVNSVIDTQHLVNDAVETAKIKNLHVTAGKLATDAVETAKIKNQNVILTKIVRSTLDTYLKAQGAGADSIFEKLALRDTGIHIGKDTRNSAGAQVIGSVGFKSSVVIFLAVDSVTTNLNRSWGFDNMTYSMCMRIADNGTNNLVVIADSMYIRRDINNFMRGVITVIGSDGFTFTWQLTGTCACNFLYLCLP